MSKPKWKTQVFGLSAAMMATLPLAQASEVVPGELLVKLRPGAEKAFFQDQKSVNTYQVEPIHLSYGDIYLMRFDEKSDVESLAHDLTSDPRVEFAEPNFIYSIVRPVKALSIDDILGTPSISKENAYTPNDPKFSRLWGLHNTGNNEPRGTKGVNGVDVNAMKAWEITKGSKDIKIAVIDTGIDYRHPDLKNNMWVNIAERDGKPGVDDDGNGYIDDIHGYDFANNDGDPMDGNSHGTHCAGTIGATHNNNIGVAGVMGKVSLVGVKFLTDSGSGSSAHAIKAIDYATKIGVDIMSNSWGGGGASQALKEAIERASDAGIIFTAAAGNSSTNNDNRPHYPSNYDVENIISVAAHTAQDTLASFSCYGKKSVHIVAPGHNILSTVKNGGYSIFSGTSMATPHVSGVIGLLLAKEGRISHAEMRERVMMTSIPVPSYRGKTIKGGRIDAYNLLTDTRPARKEPNPNGWRTIVLPTPFESVHPYTNNETLEKQYTFAGAQYIRVKVKKYDTEPRYDVISISGKNRTLSESISGQGQDYVTEFVEGDTVNIKFTSDRSVNKWGFIIEEVEVQ